MVVDWFTVIAQTINFIILMWLLKRFLYKPILNAIESREKYIRDQLADAKAIDAEAKKSQADLDSKNKEFAEQSAKLLSDTKKEAESLRTKLLNEAKEEIESLRIQQNQTLKQEMHDSMETTLHQLKKEVFSTTKKILHDLADSSLEERMISVFLNRLTAMSEKDLASILSVGSLKEVIVISGFELSKEIQIAIKKVINEKFQVDTILIKQNPKLISGIELNIAGQKLAWSSLDYLKNMEDTISTIMKNEKTVESN